ncbi:MAG: peptidylprolyl isomerase [Pseudomonadota bacterium]
MRRWLREPLVHFMVLGALIFAAYLVLEPGSGDPDGILLTQGQQEHLISAFTRTWQRPPTRAEFEGLVEDWIREEIAYREGLVMGLDADDTIIRRRLRQKLELVTEDLVGLAEPSEEELQAFLEARPEAYRLEPRHSLRQVYFSPDRRGENAARDAEQALAALTMEDAAPDPLTLGDPLPLPNTMTREWESALARQFGSVFVEGLADLEPGAWSGPVPSGYGLHLVYLEATEAGRPMTLEEARRDVRRDFENQRRLQAIDQLYDALAERYTVRIEPLQPDFSEP